MDMTLAATCLRVVMTLVGMCALEEAPLQLEETQLVAAYSNRGGPAAGEDMLEVEVEVEEEEETGIDSPFFQYLLTSTF